jgi:hypothetical protein
MTPLEGGTTSCADVAQLVEHVLGKDGVSGSIPLIGSRNNYWPFKLIVEDH